METLNQNQNDDLKHRNNEDNNDLASWIRGAVNQADAEFPLSGGETEEDFSAPLHGEEEHKSFLDDLDTRFPLSGGEAEEDLEDK